MSKGIKFFMAMVIMLIALPFGTNVVKADDGALDLEEGKYTIEFDALKEDSDDASAMANYLDDTVILEIIEKGIFLTIFAEEEVTKLEIEGEGPIEESINNDKKEMIFKLDEFHSIINAYVEYKAPYQGGFFEGEADFRLSFDIENLPIKPNETGEDPKEDPKEDPEEEPKEDPKEEPEGDTKEDPNGENGEKNLIKPDKAFEIDYTIMKEDGSGDSVADGFFEKPALLFEKDGIYYVHLTITDGEMVKEFKNKYGEALIVEKNSDGSVTLQLRVNNDLSNIDLDMHIVVPAGAIPGFPGYDEKHGAILVFDKDSKKDIEVVG